MNLVLRCIDIVVDQGVVMRFYDYNKLFFVNYNFRLGNFPYAAKMQHICHSKNSLILLVAVLDQATRPAKDNIIMTSQLSSKNSGTNSGSSGFHDN